MSIVKFLDNAFQFGMSRVSSETSNQKMAKGDINKTIQTFDKFELGTDSFVKYRIAYHDPKQAFQPGPIDILAAGKAIEASLETLVGSSKGLSTLGVAGAIAAAFLAASVGSYYFYDSIADVELDQDFLQKYQQERFESCRKVGNGLLCVETEFDPNQIPTLPMPFPPSIPGSPLEPLKLWPPIRIPQPETVPVKPFRTPPAIPIPWPSGSSITTGHNTPGISIKAR